MWLETVLTLKTVSWLVQKDIDWKKVVFYKNEVERPTDQVEIFPVGFEVLSECLGVICIKNIWGISRIEANVWMAL